MGTLLWLHCRNPYAGEHVLRYAREGGGVLAYDVTPNPPEDRAHRGEFNCRTIDGWSDVAAAMLPWLPSATVPTS